MATEVDFSYDQGTTYTKPFKVWMDPARSIEANLVGYAVSMNVCYSYDVTQVIASYSTDAGNISVNTDSSVVTVNIANNDFLNVQFPTGVDASSIDLVYDLKITAANLASGRIAQGTLTLNKQVTL